MQSIRGAMGALVLASLSTTAAATTVELEFQITTTWKEITTTYGGGRTSISDPSFQPETFTATIRFDLEHPWQRLSQPVEANASAETSFDPATTFFTSSPFTQELRLPPPSGTTEYADTTATYSQYQYGTFQDADQAMAVVKQINITAQQAWQGPDFDGTDRPNVHLYGRQIQFEADGDPLSSKQFTDLTGEDALAFLQTQIGILQRSAFQESSWRMTPGATVINPVDHYRISYHGDVVLRSVSVVPEPSTLLLMLFGGAMVAAARITRQRRPD